jgi:hypothetical protein
LAWALANVAGKQINQRRDNRIGSICPRETGTTTSAARVRFNAAIINSLQSEDLLNQCASHLGAFR